jgi:hypothetical protein
MREEARRRLAFAIAKAAGRNKTTVYSYETGRYTHIAGGPITFFDCETSTHFTDRYDYETGSHWSFRIDCDRFTGFDYGDGQHFSGTIRDGAIHIYDYGNGTWHRYMV